MSDILERLREIVAVGIAEALFVESALDEAAVEIERLRAALRESERELNDIRDSMIDDRSHYPELVDFASDVERTAAMIRAALSPPPAEDAPVNAKKTPDAEAGGMTL